MNTRFAAAPPRRILASLALVALLSGLTLAGCAGGKSASPLLVPTDATPVHRDPVGAGDSFCDFEASTLDGGTFRLAEVVGPKTVLLHFWSLSCTPCIAEFPFLRTLQETYGEDGLQVVGVNVDSFGDRLVQSGMATRNLAPPYPVVLDPTRAVARHYAPWAVPITVLIDAEGVVRSSHVGYRPEVAAELESEIQESLGARTALLK